VNGPSDPGASRLEEEPTKVARCGVSSAVLGDNRKNAHLPLQSSLEPVRAPLDDILRLLPRNVSVELVEEVGPGEIGGSHGGSGRGATTEIERDGADVTVTCGPPLFYGRKR
jgi:hypothetical protein